MTIKHMEKFRDPELSKRIADNIKKISKKPVRIMEVCGTHTVSIFRNGIRSILPETITLLSGPGCPVCVTAQKEIDAIIEMAGKEKMTIATFGDLMRVPGFNSSLQMEHSKGCDIRMVYSAFDAINIAKNNPDRIVVFPGVGFETTAPTIAASIITANRMNLENFYVYSVHKLVPPALFALMDNEKVRVDGFILPGHVSVIIGSNGYESFFNKYSVPGVIAGFEPVDILQAVYKIVYRIENESPGLENSYQRAVTTEGNPKALQMMEDVFEPVDAQWRGIGMIPGSGLGIRKKYERFDAEKMVGFSAPVNMEPKGCACGEILTGIKTPPECPLFNKQCTPMAPVGPCMVSSEGTCATYYQYSL
jgi:hydrogenase expression/formation protein HypD